MKSYAVLAWQPLLRPPLPGDEPPPVPGDAPLKALTCRNAVASAAALVASDKPIERARLVFSDLVCADAAIGSDAVTVRLVGGVPTPEAGSVTDPLYDVDEFAVDRSAALYATVRVPAGIPAGTYRGSVALVVRDREVAHNAVEIEVANVDLPDARDWSFFLNVWMNPATVARWHGVEIWSDEHFELLKPYVEDLASHGQKTAVVPICFQPWGTQTRDPFPNAVIWARRGSDYEFDFSIFDRYVRLHQSCGIDRAIHCYTIVQGPGGPDQSLIVYEDAETGAEGRIQTSVGDPEYTRAWGSFFASFRKHLTANGWFERTYIAFDEKPPDVMDKVVSFLSEHAADFKVALAANTRSDLFLGLDDLCLHTPFNEHGIAETAPLERASTGIADLLASRGARASKKGRHSETITTFYVCCGPAFPNTFLFSPLVESRMLPYLAAQGGYDGFLRWSYNDWPDDPYARPEFGPFPTGDVMFVYPGKAGPVTSLRWEQLREGIQDYELAKMAWANVRGPEEMVDYEQAIALASRNVDGHTKSIGDIEIARRLLIPIAEHGQEQ